MEQEKNQQNDSKKKSQALASMLKKTSFRQTDWRWVILVLIFCFYLANYMAYSALPSLQNNIMKTLDINLKQYNMLNSIYSMPNIICPFLAGILIDKIGIRIGIILYTTLMVIGIFIEYIAVVENVKGYPLMLIGVFFYGIGSEAMCIILSSFVSKWFIGKELSLGLGVTTASANFGSVMANWILPPISTHLDDSVVIPYLICFIVQCVGYVAAFLMCGLDKKADTTDAEKKRALFQQSSNSVEGGLLLDGADLTELEKLEKIEQDQDAHKMQFSDLKKLTNVLFWLVNWVYTFQCAALIPFQNNLQNILTSFYGQKDSDAGRILSLVTLQTAVFTPFVAHLTDKIGRRSEIFILTSIMMIITFIMWMYIPICPEGGCYWFYMPILFNGLGTSFFSAVVYPAVPLTVEKKLLGSAFGIQDCAQQLGMALAPLVAGPIQQKGAENGTYFWFYFVFLCSGFLAFGGSILLYILDKKRGSPLNLVVKDKKKTFLSIRKSAASFVR
ncbi:Major facilitator superfamily domain, general substrate transporter [Pseudocohnilembus persalinus]|uniref:Lysosomal dipeptide transporter MFSD1 n=1 Tax=Pseudocohnilembus persalinus TaxID=266149 RepID=A0A0V0QXJ2_PSEPJ|nr:Major facilitator superfamily domain, general substrate transporter [Pseudocohnilembus persalinus]|eukprot:KRX07068.1 Major facilitator superfamily domain, general substrate transporter [Pseudocohnilembus persalinus]